MGREVNEPGEAGTELDGAGTEPDEAGTEPGEATDEPGTGEAGRGRFGSKKAKLYFWLCDCGRAGAVGG